MTHAFPIEMNGNDISSYVIPASLRIQREWGSRNGYAEFVVSKYGSTTGYYDHPEDVPNIRAWWHMHEASGNLTDASGNGRTLTAVGSAVYGRAALPKGYGGRSIRFQGDGDYFSSSASGLKFLGNFTFGVWIRLSLGQIGLTGKPIMGNYGGGSSDGWRAKIINTGADYRLSMEVAGTGSDTVQVVLNSVLGDAKPHFLVVTFNNTTRVMEVWLDGESQGTDTSSVSFAAPGGDFVLGYWDPSVYYEGRMQEAFLCDGVLADVVIEDLYAQGSTVTSITRLENLSEIVIYAEDGTARFGGYASAVVPVSEGALDAAQKITVIGWERRFDSIRVTGRWFNNRTDEIIADIFGSDSRLSGYSLTKVRRGRQVDQYEKADAKLSDILDQLAAWDVFTWFVSADGTQLVYQPLSLQVKRRWYVTDDTDQIETDSYAHAVENFDFEMSLLAPLSKVIVKGGTRLQDLNPYSLDAGSAQSGAEFGADVAYVIPFDIVPRAGEDEIRVEINDGTGTSAVWNSLDFGRVDRDELLMNGGDKEVLYSPLTRMFLFDETARPPFILRGYAWRFYAQKRIAVKAIVRDAAAEARLGGLYEDVIVDTAILTEEDASRRGRQEIANRSKERPSVRFVAHFEIDGNSNQTPVKIGDLLHVINLKRGLDTRDVGDGLQVQRIVSTVHQLGGGSSRHEVFAGYWPKDDIDMQYQLSRRIERIEVDDFFDAEEEINVIDWGYDGDPSDREGVMVITEPTWGITRT